MFRRGFNWIRQLILSVFGAKTDAAEDANFFLGKTKGIAIIKNTQACQFSGIVDV